MNRRLGLLLPVAAITAQCAYGHEPPPPRWSRLTLPVNVQAPTAGDRVDVTTVWGGTGGQPWLAGGDAVDIAGNRQVQIWSSDVGPQGPWRQSSFLATSIDGPHDVVSSISAAGPLTAAVGVRPSPLHGIPRASMWTGSARSPAVWQEAPVTREVFGGENVVGIGGMTVGPHGVFLAGSWSTAGERASAAVWTSPDGLVWTRNDRDPAFVGYPPELPQASDVADSPGGVVMVGRAPTPSPGDPTAEHGAIWWSADGTRWERVLVAKGASRGTQISIDRVRYGDGRYVAAGTIESRGSAALDIWMSCDGINWRDQPTHISLSGGPTSSVTGLAVVGDAVVVGAVADQRPVLWEARRGGRWKKVGLPADSPPGADIDVTATPGAIAIAVRRTNDSGAWWAPVTPPFADRSQCAV